MAHAVMTSGVMTCGDRTAVPRSAARRARASRNSRPAPADGTTARAEASLCAERTSVELYTIEGGGHTWPGGKAYLPARIVGKVSRDVDATATMWAFFVAHGRK